jgi:hypothetical protein
MTSVRDFLLFLSPELLTKAEMARVALYATSDLSVAFGGWRQWFRKDKAHFPSDPPK